MDNTIRNFQNHNAGFLFLILAIFAFMGSFCYALAKATGGGRFETYEQFCLGLAACAGIYFVRRARQLREE